MGCVCCQDNPPHPETGGTPLLELVRAYVGDGIIAGLGISRKNLFVSLWLACNVFVPSESRDITVRYSI
jgi:hypothetical protein